MFWRERGEKLPEMEGEDERERSIMGAEGEKRKYSTSRVIILTLQNQLTNWQRCAHTR